MKTDGLGTEKKGREASGKFTTGNQIAKGSSRPFAMKVSALRKALYAAVTPEDVEYIVGELVTAAKLGDIRATTLLLDRLLGPAEAADILERLEALEQALEDRKGAG